MSISLQWSSVHDTTQLLPKRKLFLFSPVLASDAAEIASLSLPSPNSSLQFSMPQHAVAGTASNFLAFVLGSARAPVSFSFTKRASSNSNAPLQHNHGIRASEFFNQQSSSSWATSAVSKGRSKFRIALELRSLNFVWKSLTPSQSHCSGSCSIRISKAHWDSGYAPIINPAFYSRFKDILRFLLEQFQVS